MLWLAKRIGISSYNLTKTVFSRPPACLHRKSNCIQSIKKSLDYITAVSCDTRASRDDPLTCSLFLLLVHGALQPSDHCTLLLGDAAVDGGSPRVLLQALPPKNKRRVTFVSMTLCQKTSLATYFIAIYSVRVE